MCYLFQKQYSTESQHNIELKIMKNTHLERIMSLFSHHFNNNQNNNNCATSYVSLSLSASDNSRVSHNSVSSPNQPILRNFRKVPIPMNSNDVHKLLEGKNSIIFLIPTPPIQSLPLFDDGICEMVLLSNALTLGLNIGL